MFEYHGIKIRWYGHDTFTLEKEITICIDPYKLSKTIQADLVLISHNHFDHLSLEDLKKISSINTIIIAANECMSQISNISFKEKIGIAPGEEKTINNVTVKAVPAYNINKINPDTKKPFHPKDDKKIGFIITIHGTSIYHTGDSELIPVSGTYVMTAKDAADAVEKIKPKIAIPMHYGTIVGSENDAKEFKNMVKSCKVQILTKE